MNWFIWENKKHIRHSQDYYKWLLNAMDKRKADEIVVKFSKNKFGTYYRKQIMQNIKN